MKVTDNGFAIWPDLVEPDLQKVGRDGSRNSGEQHVIAASALVWRFPAAPGPPGNGKSTQDMLVRTPRDGFRDFLGRRRSAPRNRARNSDIGFGWSDSEWHLSENSTAIDTGVAQRL